MARHKSKRRPWDLVEIHIACQAERGEIPAVARLLDRTVASCGEPEIQAPRRAAKAPLGA